MPVAMPVERAPLVFYAYGVDDVVICSRCRKLMRLTRVIPHTRRELEAQHVHEWDMVTLQDSEESRHIAGQVVDGLSFGR
jgi:hypothetical protein